MLCLQKNKPINSEAKSTVSTPNPEKQGNEIASIDGTSDRDRVWGSAIVDERGKEDRIGFSSGGDEIERQSETTGR